MDAMSLSIALWRRLFHSSRSAISKSRTVTGGLHAQLDLGPESTLAIPYAVSFQLQECSPTDKLYAIGHYQ